MDQEDPTAGHADLETMAPAPEGMETEDGADRRWAGCWFGMKLHLLIAVPLLLILAAVRRDLLAAAIATFCIWQWFYLGPAIMIERLHGRVKRARGVMLSGLTTMALATLLFFLAIAILCFGPYRM